MHTYQDPGMGLVKHWLGKTLAWWDPGLVGPWLAGRTLTNLEASTVQVGYGQFLYCQKCYFQRSDFVTICSELVPSVFPLTSFPCT